MIEADEFDKPLDVRLRRKWRESLRPWCAAPKALTTDPIVDQEDDLPNIEDFAPTPRVPPAGFELMPMPGSAWIGNVLIAMMIAASVVHWRWPENTLSPMVASGDSVFQKGEYWRLFTALLGHGDMMHILHNGPIFWFFAWILNAYFGAFAGGVLILLVGIISNLVTLWSYDPQMQLLGASGMVYGMVAMWLVLYIRFDRKGWWVKRVMRSLGFSLLVLFPQSYDLHVSYMAHASGFITGIVIALCWMPFAMKFAPVRHDPYYRWTDYEAK